MGLEKGEILHYSHLSGVPVTSEKNLKLLQALLGAWMIGDENDFKEMGFYRPRYHIIYCDKFDLWIENKFESELQREDIVENGSPESISFDMERNRYIRLKKVSASLPRITEIVEYKKFEEKFVSFRYNLGKGTPFMDIGVDHGLIRTGVGFPKE